MYYWVSVVILTAALIFMASVAIYYKRKNSKSTCYLSQNIQKNRDLSDFMTFFSESLTASTKSGEIFFLIAEKISKILNVEEVCIYEASSESILIPVGYTQNFPPLQKLNAFKLSKPRYAVESLKNERIPFGTGIIGKIAESKLPILIDTTNEKNASSQELPSSVKSLIAVPLVYSDEVKGVICVINPKGNKHFECAHLESLETIGRLVLTLHNIIFAYSNLAKQQRIDQELQFTKVLQKSLLPKSAPSWEPFIINAFTRSAKEVNGDFYDFVEIDNNKLLIVIGDASGKGIPACMVMAMTRSFIRANINRFTTLSDMFNELNFNLYRDTDEGRFTTLACCLLDKEDHTVEFVRAGHTELFIYSHKQKVRKIRPDGTALGLLPNSLSGDYDTFSFVFKPYYSMMLFSDGIVEASNEAGEEFGIEKLKNILYESSKKKNSPTKTTEKIINEINEFSGDSSQTDDQTIIVISHKDAFI